MLAAHGEPPGDERNAAVRDSQGRLDGVKPVLSAGASSLVGDDFVAVHMSWGAVNEWTTRSGYARLIERERHPALSGLNLSRSCVRCESVLEVARAVADRGKDEVLAASPVESVQVTVDLPGMIAEGVQMHTAEMAVEGRARPGWVAWPSSTRDGTRWLSAEARAQTRIVSDQPVSGLAYLTHIDGVGANCVG
ncbi:MULTISPECIES: hypothetical protein [Pseudofrankia]|uniref:hypothetical protein n=1 Tax=Pseudofrankia TaxID=2994363 RepID=UPI000234C59E|nr:MULTISPECIES: hypothetical protein [Pseudofrankia]OHV37106.1 hypothetical protein BCD49_18150 [Pseudofrankia sp. EUN1h]